MHRLYYLLSALFLASCLSPASKGDEEVTLTTDFYKISGPTMGTTYHITYEDSLGRNLQAQVDSLLLEVNLSLSTYIASSLISRFNKAGQAFDLSAEPEPLRRHFLNNYLLSQKVYAWSQGFFDPTVMPLVNYWGFGYTPKGKGEQVDSALVDSLRSLVGMDKLILEGALLKKGVAGMQLDFSAVAKGYGVDVTGDLLTSLGLCNWLVEIGGEVAASGHSPRGTPWVVGINKPEEGASPLDFELRLRMDTLCGLLWPAGKMKPIGPQGEVGGARAMRGLATSGNYRNFYEEGGEKFVHTIDPHSGYTRRSALLSASILAPTCAEADALATACMAMGKEDALKMVERLKNVEACLIFVGPSGKREMGLSHGLGTFVER